MRKNGPNVLHAAGQAAGNTLGFVAMRGLVLAVKAYDTLETRRDRRLMLQGITDGPQLARDYKELGTTVERATAFQNLQKSLERRFEELAAWQVFQETVKPGDDQDIDKAPQGIRQYGDYSTLLLLDPEEKGAGKIFSIVRQDARAYGRGISFTVKSINIATNPDGSRDETAFGIGEENWNCGSPFVQINNYNLSPSTQETSTQSQNLPGSLDLAQAILKASSIEATGGSMMSAPAANEFSVVTSRLTPILY